MIPSLRRLFGSAPAPVSTTRRRGRKMTPADYRAKYAEIVAMREAGMRCCDIADRTGKLASQVSFILRRCEIEVEAPDYSI